MRGARQSRVRPRRRLQHDARQLPWPSRSAQLPARTHTPVDRDLLLFGGRRRIERIAQAHDQLPGTTGERRPHRLESPPLSFRQRLGSAEAAAPGAPAARVTGSNAMTDGGLLGWAWQASRHVDPSLKARSRFVLAALRENSLARQLMTADRSTAMGVLLAEWPQTL